MDLILKSGTDFASTFERARQAAPEAFDTSSIRNLVGGEWVSIGVQQPHQTPVDQSFIIGPTMLSLAQSQDAVDKAIKMHEPWSKTSLDDRKAKV
jgi:delta 1-pyrroline-5-carboxylate dehydrogenase